MLITKTIRIKTHILYPKYKVEIGFETIFALSKDTMEKIRAIKTQMVGENLAEKLFGEFSLVVFEQNGIEVDFVKVYLDSETTVEYGRTHRFHG